MSVGKLEQFINSKNSDFWPLTCKLAKVQSMHSMVECALPPSEATSTPKNLQQLQKHRKKLDKLKYLGISKLGWSSNLLVASEFGFKLGI